MMQKLLINVIFVIFATFCVKGEDVDSYMKRRNTIFMKDESNRLGHRIKLSESEKKVNEFITQLKLKELRLANQTDYYPPAVNFLKARKEIEKSYVFKIIKRMPKGAALHLHDTSVVTIDKLIAFTTYRDDCYMCNKNGTVQFAYFDKQPKFAQSECKWTSVNLLRKLSGNPKKFDAILYDALSMVNVDPASSQKELWTKFQGIFDKLATLVFYGPVFPTYYNQSLQELLDDNIQYAEIRYNIPKVPDKSGVVHDTDWLVKQCSAITDAFIHDHPEFIGAKLISEVARKSTAAEALAKLKDTIRLRDAHPSIVAGYDLVAREDTGYTLLDYLPVLLYPSQQTPPIDIPYFFHAGETDWNGTPIDENLLDAVLLNTSRIGHGYAILKHPAALSSNIPVEVNPVSNQVLGLVSDLRNHPAAVLFTRDYPIVISSDDPTVWGARGLSYDWYEAFMALGGHWADLRTLKQLAINSIQYSAMDDGERSVAMAKWSAAWHQFILDTVQFYQL